MELVALDVCPVRLFRAWLAASEIKSGPLFRRIDKGGNLGVHALAPQTRPMGSRSAGSRQWSR